MVDFLRRWRHDDAEALVEIYGRADADLLSNVPDDRTLAGAQAWIEDIRTAEDEGSVIAFAIMKAASASEADPPEAERSDGAGVAVGNVMAAAIERSHSTAWISYWLDPASRGQELAAAGLRSLVDHLHDEAEVYRLELGYRVNNPPSAAVARNAGFLVEGRERERLSHDGVRFDTEVCARLAGDPRASGWRLPISHDA